MARMSQGLILIKVKKGKTNFGSCLCDLNILLDFIMFVSEKQGTLPERVLQQAHQKAFQIKLQSDKQSHQLFSQLFQSQASQIDEEYHHLLKKQQTVRKVNMSALKNNHKMRRIRKKYQLCESLFAEVQKKLKGFANSRDEEDEYRVFLVASIVEGLIRMFQSKILIRCTIKDRNTLQQLLPYIQQVYNDFTVTQLGFPTSQQIAISTADILLEREVLTALPKDKQGQTAMGGVILVDSTGNITLKATLDSRLNILRDLSLPMIRSMIWGEQRAKQ